MSVGQQGQVKTFFWDLRARPPVFLSLKNVFPTKAPSKHDLQKLWAQGVVIGKLITSRQIRQLNSALIGTSSKWNLLKKNVTRILLNVI